MTVRISGNARHNGSRLGGLVPANVYSIFLCSWSKTSTVREQLDLSAPAGPQLRSTDAVRAG